MQIKGSYNQKKAVISSISGFNFIRRNKISKAKINKKVEIGSTWQAPLLSEKYSVVVPPLITKDS